MRERDVDEAAILAVIASPATSTFDPNKDSFRLERKVGGLLLKVWVRAPWPPAPGSQVVVKSVAWKD